MLCTMRSCFMVARNVHVLDSPLCCCTQSSHLPAVPFAALLLQEVLGFLGTVLMLATMLRRS